MRLRGRAYTRCQRKRMIRRRMPLYPWVDKPGKLAKHSYRYRCTCEWCADTRHAHVRRRWKRAAWREIETYWNDCYEAWRELCEWMCIECDYKPPTRAAIMFKEAMNMRIDVNHPRARHCQPYLDGKPVRYCIEADDEEGWVKRYKADVNGEITVNQLADNDDGLLTVETLHGKVELVFSDKEEPCLTTGLTA